MQPSSTWLQLSTLEFRKLINGMNITGDKNTKLGQNRLSHTSMQANQFKETVPSQRQILSIKLDLYRRLTAFADKNQATTYHLILGALYCYFIRTSDIEELVIGLSVLNRKTAAFKRTVGLFTSIIPARFRFGTNLSFVDLIHAIGMELRQEYRHQRFPMSDIVKSVANHSQTPLFDIVMAYQKHDYPAQFTDQPAQVETLTNGFEHNTLFISVEEYQQNRDVRLTFDYQRDAFNEADMAVFYNSHSLSKNFTFFKKSCLLSIKNWPESKL